MTKIQFVKLVATFLLFLLSYFLGFPKELGAFLIKGIHLVVMLMQGSSKKRFFMKFISVILPYIFLIILNI